VRLAAVEVISAATLAAFIGGGGLGEYIINGPSEQRHVRMLVTGALAHFVPSVERPSAARNGRAALSERDADCPYRVGERFAMKTLSRGRALSAFSLPFGVAAGVRA